MKQLQQILFSNEICTTLEQILATLTYDHLFILTDTNTLTLSYPLLQPCKALEGARCITIDADDTHKTLDALAQIWLALSQQGATRRSLLINLGGGMVTDIGGFAASTFKRGIHYINIPTTLLGAVDAAVGGKTGINFNGLKNEIGAFNPALAVVVSTQFFATLSLENVTSGYAEMLKHGLISSVEIYDKLLACNLTELDPTTMLQLVEESVSVKERVVESDPKEQGIRKALNLGHTIGHAFESLSHERNAPVLHGYAVAWGLVCELLVAHLQLKFPTQRIHQLAQFVQQNFGTFHITCDDYAHLYELMTHDKKNESTAHVNFTLLTDIGEVVINQTATKEQIEIALDLYRDLFKI